MSRPLISSAVTPVLEEARRQETRELTILENGSNQSIYSLVFDDVGVAERIQGER